MQRPFRYAIEEILPGGTKLILKIPPGWGYTWREAWVYALELMRKSDWTRDLRVVLSVVW